jgi:hypothetical protein
LVMYKGAVLRVNVADVSPFLLQNVPNRHLVLLLHTTKVPGLIPPRELGT